MERLSPFFIILVTELSSGLVAVLLIDSIGLLIEGDVGSARTAGIGSVMLVTLGFTFSGDMSA